MESFSFRNKEIEIEESSSPSISIDGESIQVSHDAEAGEFNSGELPYQSFETVRKLAEAIVVEQLTDG